MSIMGRNRHTPEVPLRRRQRASGQSMVETCIALTIVMMLVVAIIHLSMIAVTRYMTNYAAFSAARVMVYGGGSPPDDPLLHGSSAEARRAAETVMDMFPWGDGHLYVQRTGGAYRVELTVPFGYPLFNNAPGARTIVRSEAPLYTQPDIPEVGDNAAKKKK